MIVAHYDYTQIQIQIHIIEGHTFATVWNTDYRRGPVAQIIEKDWTPDQKFLADNALSEYLRTNKPAEVEPATEAERLEEARDALETIRELTRWIVVNFNITIDGLATARQIHRITVDALKRIEEKKS